MDTNRRQAVLRLIKNRLDERSIYIFDDFEDWEGIMDYDEFIWCRNHLTVETTIAVEQN